MVAGSIKKTALGDEYSCHRKTDWPLKLNSSVDVEWLTKTKLSTLSSLDLELFADCR